VADERGLADAGHADDQGGAAGRAGPGGLQEGGLALAPVQHLRLVAEVDHGGHRDGVPRRDRRRASGRGRSPRLADAGDDGRVRGAPGGGSGVVTTERADDVGDEFDVQPRTAVAEDVVDGDPAGALLTRWDPAGGADPGDALRDLGVGRGPGVCAHAAQSAREVVPALRVRGWVRRGHPPMTSQTRWWERRAFGFVRDTRAGARPGRSIGGSVPFFPLPEVS
jgi:hypothetical protein